MKLCLENCGQTATGGDMVTIDSFQKVFIVPSKGTVADPLRLSFRHKQTTTDSRYSSYKASG